MEWKDQSKQVPVARYDMRAADYGLSLEEFSRSGALCFSINHETPFSDRGRELTDELLGEPLDERSAICPPFQIDMGHEVHLGRHVFINNNLICMARGGVAIDDDVMVGPGVTILTANHDFADHEVLLCKPVHICRGAWVGAEATLLPGVTVGENAVVAGAAVVTKDVEPNTVVGGNPAHVLKRLDQVEGVDHE
jgi:acetyltransferase-like isoleucine patch superfamily enzyme